jgi:S-DNA-T family DNA segregation ATPase FtsK/SpoIIIE
MKIRLNSLYLIHNLSQVSMEIQNTDDGKAKFLVGQLGVYDHKLELSSYKYPTLDLLNNSGVETNLAIEELDNAKRTIVETLGYAKIEVTHIKATVGPRAILYEIIPAPGVRIAQVMNMEADLALRLGLDGIKVIGAIPGKGTIGIEAPHIRPTVISLRSVLATEKFLTEDMELPLALGRTMANELFMLDLAKLPHLLIAGSTGQGKSVTLNATIASLLYKKHPSELKLILIDFNKLEFSPYRKIECHFLAKLPDTPDAIVSDIKSAVDVLTSLNIELDQRYELFGSAQVRNLNEYNQKFISRKLDDPAIPRYLPYLVVIIDEYADLITSENAVEGLITRLAQLGRSAGIHLIISTQRPSVKIITGDIKANFISRLALRVATSIDSRTIIDDGGAEKLKGEGDMLCYTGNNIIRLQAAFIDTSEVEKLVDFIGNQRGYSSAMYLPKYIDENIRVLEFDPDSLDPLFEDSAQLIVLHQQGSASLIQRKLKLGYNRAGRIIDQLEAAKIIGPFEGSKARDVLFSDEYSLGVYLEVLRSGKMPDTHSEPAATFIQQEREKQDRTLSEVLPRTDPRPEISQPEVPRKKTFFERLFKL